MMKLRTQALRDRVASCLPDRFREWSTHAGLFILTAAGLRVPIVLLRGPTRPAGRPGTLLTAGHEPWIRYLPNRFFSGEPTRESLGAVSFRELPDFLDRFRKHTDLTIIRVNRWSEKSLLRQDCLTVPEWIGMALAVPRDLEKLIRSGGSIKRDMTLVRRHGFQPIVVSGAKEFDIFYHSAYVPFSRNRYRELAYIRNPCDLQRCLARGGILWVHREGKRAAAILFEQKSHTLDLVALGTMNGDLTLVQDGAVAALYYYVIRLAQDLGCTTVDFRGSRPSLRDGLLRYKSKWGASLYDRTDCYYDLLVSWEDPNQVVHEFFTHTPLIFRENGRLSALAGGESQNPYPLWVDGLHRMHLLRESGRCPLNVERPEGATID